MRMRCLETMCTFEKGLPPSLFDIQEHLVCHLIDEMEKAGVIHARWMY